MPRRGRGRSLSTTQDPLIAATRWQPHARPHPPPPPPPPPSSSSVPPASRPPKHQRRKGHAQHHSPTSWQPAHLRHFSPTAAEWLPLPLNIDDSLDPAATAATSHNSKHDPPTKLTVLTYNTWSSSPSHTSAQSRAILDLLHTSRSDLVVLQEVTSAFFRLLSHETWLHDDWVVSTPEEFWQVAGKGAKKRGKEGDDEACVVLVRRALAGSGSEVKMLRLDRARDEGGRAAIALKLCSRGVEQVRLVTSHFSPLPDNAPLRSRQYKACLSFLSAASPNPPSSSSYRPPRPPLRLLVGDLNASSAAELAPFSSPPHSLTDACPSAPPPRAPASAHDASFASPPTFGHLYPLVTVHSRKARKARRIDRMYFSGSAGAGGSGSRSSSGSGGGARVRVARYEHLGGERAVEGRDRTGRDSKVWASDHEAVRVELEWGG
ncbi:hypothetical protein JCM8208_002687 [Rhodotorula glutinis]